MKLRTLFSLCLGGIALTALAQGGYQDGVDYYNADRFEKARTILQKTLNDASTNKAVSYFSIFAKATSREPRPISTMVSPLIPTTDTTT